MRATSASKSASQPYSRAYSAPWAWITQPRSPGSGSRSTNSGGRAGPSMTSLMLAIAAVSLR